MKQKWLFPTISSHNIFSNLKLKTTTGNWEPVFFNISHDLEFGSGPGAGKGLDKVNNLRLNHNKMKVLVTGIRSVLGIVVAWSWVGLH